MQRVITHLAARFGLDLAADEAYLKLENGPYTPLVVEKVGRNLLSVAHYVEEGGDLCADPEVVFFTGYPQWVPIEITQRPPAGYRVYAEPSADGKEIARLDAAGQSDLARFVEVWARNLAAQGWVERARKAREPEPEAAGRYPVLEHLGATAYVAQAVFNGSHLYHTVLIGHQVALKALRAALWMGQYLAFPDTGQVQRSSYASGPAFHSLTRVGEVVYHSRIVGDQERGLYTMAIWANNRDLLEKGRCFYLVDPHPSPTPIPDYDYGEERPALPRPSADVLGRFYAWLNEALLTPLREEWAGRLWEEGSQTPAWTPLVDVAYSLGGAGWVVRTEESAWEEIVREIVRER
jgi:hypothetical protein